MPKKWSKSVVLPGTYTAPAEGGGSQTVRIPPERIQHWADSFRRMKADKIKLPLSWGHQPQAYPIAEADIAASEFAKSRYLATYLDDLQVGPTGDLVAIGDPPPGYEVDPITGSLVNKTDGTQIAEVSLACCDWTDGKGQVWTDAPRHLALTPLPVAHGTDGFRPVDGPIEKGELRLSLSAYRKTAPFQLATEPNMDKPEPKNGDKPPEKKGDGSYTVADAVKELATFEPPITLPSDTDEKNFAERLCIALKAIKASGNGGGAAPEPPKEEPPPTPTMMSLSAIPDPVTRQLAAQFAESQRDKRLTRIADLERRGYPAHRCKSLRERATKVELSVNMKTGVFSRPGLDDLLDEIDAALPKQAWDDRQGFRFSTEAKEQNPPDDFDSPEAKDKRAEAKGREMARAAGLIPADEVGKK